MANYTAEVIRYLRRKGSDGFSEPVSYLGAEQRFVGALRNSGLNNLEEQYILGTDTYTETYLDKDGNQIVEKSYHINDSTHSLTDYYKLVTKTYKDGTMNEDFFFDGDTVKLPDDTNEVIFGNGTDPFTDTAEVYCVNEKTFIEDNGTLKVFPSSYTIIKTEDLYFVTNNGASTVHVLGKVTGRKYVDDGTKEVVRENVTNYLKVAVNGE